MTQVLALELTPKDAPGASLFQFIIFPVDVLAYTNGVAALTRKITTNRPTRGWRLIPASATELDVTYDGYPISVDGAVNRVTQVLLHPEHEHARTWEIRTAELVEVSSTAMAALRVQGSPTELSALVKSSVENWGALSIDNDSGKP